MPIKVMHDGKQIAGPKKRKNTRRENRLEELGRVDAEKAYSKKGKRNLSEEKSRIRKELATGSSRPKRRVLDRLREITDPTKKKKYQDLLDRRSKPIKPLRRLSPEQRERIKKQLYAPEMEELKPFRKNRKNLRRDMVEPQRPIGGRKKAVAHRSGGGIAQRGFGRAFMKGGKV